MKKRNLWIGILVAAAVVLFGAGLFLVGNQHKAFRSHSEFYTDFENLSGISKGAKVRVNGMDAGQVSDVFIPTSPEKFRLKMTLEDRIRGLIRENSVVTIESDGLVGDKFLLIGGGSAASPQAAPQSTLRSKEPASISKMMDQANGIMTQVGGTITQVDHTLTHVNGAITDVQGKLNGTLNAATATINNTNGAITDVRHGKGSVGVLLEDPTTAANVKQIVVNARDATASLNTASTQVNGMIGEMQQRQIVAKVDDTLKNTKSATAQLDQASKQINTTLKSALAPDQFGQGAGTNLQQSLTNINLATGNLADDTEALKHEFFFKGFFKKRGYDSLDRLPVDSYRDGKLLKKRTQNRQWISSAQLFEHRIAPNNSTITETLSASGRAAIEAAASQIPDLYTSALIVEGYADPGTPGEMLVQSRQRAIVIRDYLQLRFNLAPQKMGVIGMSETPPVGSGKQTWDGISIVRLAPSK